MSRCGRVHKNDQELNEELCRLHFFFKPIHQSCVEDGFFMGFFGMMWLEKEAQCRWSFFCNSCLH
jgi:hypothetical protein